MNVKNGNYLGDHIRHIEFFNLLDTHGSASITDLVFDLRE